MPRLRDYLDALRDHYGPLRPADPAAPFEPFVRAILAPGASPKSLDKALHTLKVYRLLDPAKIRELDADTLSMAVKAAGAAKAARLKRFVDWLYERFDGDPGRLTSLSLDRLRDELLESGGLSPETADQVLLHALGLPSPVVDLSTYRVLTRHELVVEDAGYDDLRELVAKALPKESYAEFHTLAVAVGREYCRAKARCEKCPLRPLLPPGSPLLSPHL